MEESSSDEEFEQAVLRAVERKALSSYGSAFETLGSVRRRVLKRTARILDLPFSHCTGKTCNENCILLDPTDLAVIDKAWNDILKLGDHRVSNNEKVTYERFKSNDRHVLLPDLIRFLGILFAKNSIPGKSNRCREEKICKKRSLNALLAVDGFCGFLPRDYKHYVEHLKKSQADPHVRGVRSMYALFDESNLLYNLTGTDSACFVFLALLKLYSERHRSTDDQTRFVIGRTRKYVESFL